MKPLLLLFFFTPILICRAQLTADFTTSDGLTGGCSPFSASYKNLTTGASSKAVYKWDLGNNNTSSFKNPGASYSIEKTYTVMLTVTDSGHTSTKTLNIVVYKKPVVDFTITNTKGCVPLTTTFISKATAGDGSIINSFWDFGDGTTISDSNSATITHTFTSTQAPRIDLIVTNSYGCQSVLRKSTAIQVQPLPVVSFSVINPFLCKMADTAFIKNNSTGAGILSYVWNFGDNSISTFKDAAHSYQAKGNYDVTLTVTSNFGVGCSNSLKKSEAVSVANFNSDIILPAIACNNVATSFQSKNSIDASTTEWVFSDDSFQKIITGAIVSKVFSRVGQASVKMINTFGTCKDTVIKTFTIAQLPSLNNFLITNNIKCSLPATVTLEDTSLTAVKWFWNLQGSNLPSATTQSGTVLYNQEGTYSIGLTITNRYGCSASINKSIDVQIPKVVISNLPSSSPTVFTGCAGFGVTFTVTPSASIASYLWDFGDSTNKSTEAQPTHIFNKYGLNNVSLQYTTVDGCTGVTNFAKDIIVYEKPTASFITSDTVVCGSTIITFTDQSVKSKSWSWFFGDNTSMIGLSGGNNKVITHQYKDSGYYSITLIGYNNTCSDTIVKTRAIKVMPLFGGITNVSNTCSGLRDSIYLTHNYRFADKITWGFGDGTSEVISTAVTTIAHSYKQTGVYKIYITASSNACTLNDSTTAFVMLKQAPQLKSDKVLLCLNDSITIQISQLENNPYIGKNYALAQWQFRSGNIFNGNSNLPLNFAFASSLTGKLWNLKQGNQLIRAIIKSDNFGCYDTTNYVAITTKGSTAGFAVINNQSCFKQGIYFKDTSKIIGQSAVKREWLFGDSTSAVRLDAAVFSHTYTTPASYIVQLKITDTDGCFSKAQNTATPLQIIGPKVNFDYNPTEVLAGSTVTYSNTINTYGNANTIFLWSFTVYNSTSSNSAAVAKTYNNSFSVDTVRLIAKDAASQCADTIIKVVPIIRMELAFTFTTQYINNVSCPPLVAYFKTTLKAVNTVSWNFGDGTSAGNNTSPSHTYNKPGIYKITLYAVGNNNLTDSVSDYVTIKGPYATLKTNTTQSCVPATIILKANAKYATTYMWDFGDGTLSNKYDTIAQHKYTIAGIYNPALIIKDSAGCSSFFNLPNSLIIDTLQANIIMPISAICKAGTIAFLNKINSMSDSVNPSLTQYRWAFGTGNPADTSNVNSPSFYYNKIGKYQVNLKITTASGCTGSVYDSVEVMPVAITKIISKTSICESDSIAFSATSSIANDVVYNWDFGNGQTGNTLNPILQKYSLSATPYNVVLVSLVNGCYDTSVTTIIVRANPIINITPKTKSICLGDSVLLTAHDGISYKWQSDTASIKNTYLAKPVISRNYIVTVKNEFGCINNDVARVNVTAPFKLSVSNDTVVCVGGSMPLYALGAASVRWLDGAEDLSDKTIANPIAKPSGSKHFTVIGVDIKGCFADTASINITVLQLPTIAATANKIIGTGSSTTLTSKGSNDIVKWSWSPATYLNSTTVQSPISTPRTNITYVVTGTTKYGCEAKDSVNIKLQCQENNLFIPTAFTPNKDRLNDFFYPLGKGIRLVKHFVVFNRAGEKIFEKSNFNINDAYAGWNGMFKSIEAPSGVYVYMIEVECDTGDIFTSKNTVTLIR